jgi:hypothetical protein
MAGERASTTRQRLAGEICTSCGVKLADEPPTPGERLCGKCRPPEIHRIYMYYMYRENWMCQFLEEDLKTPLPRRFYFKDPEKIRRIVEKVGNFADLQDRQALRAAAKIGPYVVVGFDLGATKACGLRLVGRNFRSQRCPLVYVDTP